MRTTCINQLSSITRRASLLGGAKRLLSRRPRFAALRGVGLAVVDLGDWK
jgi:hypothetical protein